MGSGGSGGGANAGGGYANDRIGGGGAYAGGGFPAGAPNQSGMGPTPGYAARANAPEMRTYKDASGNTVKVYQTSYGGGLNEAHGYREVYSPAGKLMSTTKPQASANTPQPRVPISGSRSTTGSNLSGTGAGQYGVYSGPK